MREAFKFNSPIFIKPEYSKEDIEAIKNCKVSPEAEAELREYLDKRHNDIMQPVIERCKKALEATNERTI